MDVDKQLAEWKKQGIVFTEGKAVKLPGVVKHLSSLENNPAGNEKEFTKEVIEFAQARGWKVAHFRTVRVARMNGEIYYETPVQGDGKGFPDLLMVRGTEKLVAELKVKGNTTSEEQDAWLDAFRLAGIPAFVWFPKDWDMIELVLSLADDKRKG